MTRSVALGSLVMLCFVAAAAPGRHPAFSEETEQRYVELDAESEAIRRATKRRNPPPQLTPTIQRQMRDNIGAWSALYDRATDELQQYALRHGPASDCSKRSRALAENRPDFEAMQQSIMESPGEEEIEKKLALFGAQMTIIAAWADAAEPWYVASLCSLDVPRAVD